MKIYQVTDPAFNEYGKVLEHYDFGELFAALSTLDIPEKGTNGKKTQFTAFSQEDAMSAGANKWLLAHPDSDEAQNGAYVGLRGENITLSEG